MAVVTTGDSLDTIGLVTVLCETVVVEASDPQLGPSSFRADCERR